MNQSPQALTLRDLAAALGVEARGDMDTMLDGVATLETASAGKVVRVESAKYLAAALDTRASALLVPPEIEVDPEVRPTLTVPRPRLAFAQCARLFQQERPLRPGVHASAVVSEGVTLGEGCEVGAHVFLGTGARIGERVCLSVGAIVMPDVQVGSDSWIGPGVKLCEGTRVGSRVRIHAGAVLGADGFSYEPDGEAWFKIPHSGGVRVEDEVEIGANTTIDRGTVGDTVIGFGTKIDNQVQIGHNVQIGRHCMIVSQVGISGSVRLEDGVVLAGQAGVNPGVTVGAGSQVAGKTGVWGDLPPGSVVSGNPARPHRENLRVQALLRRLPELIRQLKRRQSDD